MENEIAQGMLSMWPSPRLFGKWVSDFAAKISAFYFPGLVPPQIVLFPRARVARKLFSFQGLFNFSYTSSMNLGE
jgi:hypothetical protein